MLFNTNTYLQDEKRFYEIVRDLMTKHALKDLKGQHGFEIIFYLLVSSLS